MEKAKKLKLNIAELICQGLALTLLFIPGMFYWEHWEEFMAGGYELKFQLSVSFMHATGNVNALLGYLMILLMATNIVILLLEIFNPQIKIKKILNWIFPVTTVGLMIITAVICSIQDSFGYKAPINWLFYFEMLILVTIAIISFIKISKKIGKI